MAPPTATLEPTTSTAGAGATVLEFPTLLGTITCVCCWAPYDASLGRCPDCAAVGCADDLLDLDDLYGAHTAGKVARIDRRTDRYDGGAP